MSLLVLLIKLFFLLQFWFLPTLLHLQQLQFYLFVEKTNTKLLKFIQLCTCRINPHAKKKKKKSVKIFQ